MRLGLVHQVFGACLHPGEVLRPCGIDGLRVCHRIQHGGHGFGGKVEGEMAFFLGEGKKQFIHELGKCHGHGFLFGCFRIQKLECEGQMPGDLFHRALAAQPRAG